MSAPTPHVVNIKIHGEEVTLETGRIARQASAAVLARRGDDVVLATVVAASTPREGIDFFPLVVEYREKLAAAGRIPGSFNRREGRITDAEILVCRIIDRTVRSLFPDGYKNEVQVQATVMSAAPGSDVQTLALLASTAAIHLSAAPAAGPAAGVRIAKLDDRWVSFPNLDQRAEAELDFVVSAGPDGLVMVEGEAREAAEDDCLAALQQALEWTGRCHKAFAELHEKAGRDKQPVPAAPELPEVPDDVQTRLRDAVAVTKKQERYEAANAVRDEWLATLPEDADVAAHKTAFGKARYHVTRDRILDGQRPDGRGPKDIRPIWCEVGWLPRAHGSAIFTRGETQSLVSCTLGSVDEAQRLDSLAGSGTDTFLLHYNFPPYSVGEVRPMRGPGRREIGHGTLAKRGLSPQLPVGADYPYTIRIESEISESNGSSSMATVCGGSLALMHAGVPVSRATAGIAMGLVTDGKRTAILSDILGDEDHLGDMDFKVVGTTEGVTALQLDNKVGGLAFETLADALGQAKAGREHILAEMAKTLDAPTKDGAAHAPQVMRTTIMPSSIGALVGARGANIRNIQESTGAKVSIEDDGGVLIYASHRDSARKALAMVQRSAGILKVGKCYRGSVTGVKDFGAFVRINQGNEGLVPVEELGGERGERPDHICKEGDEIVVEVLGADDRGRLRLSARKAIGVTDTEIVF